MVESLNEKRISVVIKKSPAYKAGIRQGDAIVSINGTKITDVFDFRYLSCDSSLDVLYVTKDGEEKTAHIDKDEYEDLGLEFFNPMLCKDKSCANKCVFCFIDQMPPGMRDTLYFKDDDLRLSFLTGNYVTLTNCTFDELKRLAGYHISPINVSIHTVNPELRVKMLGHQGAGNIMEKIKLLLDNGITVNGQVVLVPDMNNGEELKRTLDELLNLPENFECCSFVPVGITKFRENLPEIRTFTKAEAEIAIDLIEDYQKMARIKRGTSLFYASDELYIIAERPLPKTEDYDGFPSLEDGVGMLRLLRDEVGEYLSGDGIVKEHPIKLRFLKNKKIRGTIVTGKIASKTIKTLTLLVKNFAESYGADFDVSVTEITNNYFGEKVTVSGLITAKDIIDQLKDKDLGGRIIIPINMLKSGEDLFLDGMRIPDVEKALGVKVVVNEKSGKDFVNKLLFEI